MSHHLEPELRPTYETDPPMTVTHGGVLVTFPHPNTLKQRLEYPNETVRLLYREEDDLPEPCTEASIIYRYNTLDASPEVQLAATIEFNIPEESIDQHMWQVLLRRYIDKELTRSGVSTAKLSHHQTVLYAQLDDVYATQLSLLEHTNSYSVEMSLERISAIMSSQVIHEHTVEPDYFESHTNLHEASDTPPYELVQKFTHQWAVALSSIKKVFGPPSSASGISTFIVNMPKRTESKPATPAELREQLKQHDAPEIPETTFEDIGGAFYAKEQLRPIAYSFLYPDLARHYDIQPTSFMLYGPGGTGKTSLVHAFANTVQAELREYSSADIVSKWVGKSGERMAAIFDSAKKTEDPLVLFFDEFDSIAPKGAAGTSERQDVKNILKRELSTIAKHHPNIVVATATNNDPYDFDEPLLRAGRLQPIPVSIPTDAERAEIWQRMLKRSIERVDLYVEDTPPSNIESETYTPAKQPVYATDLELTELVHATSGMTGADIEQILLSARMKAFVSAVDTGNLTTLTHATLMAAISAYQKP